MRWQRGFFFIGVCLVLAGLLCGCGYTTRSSIGNRFQTIHVEPFLNKIELTKETNVQSRYKIYRPYLETDITRAVNDKYLFDGNLRPVRKELADVVLKGELVEFLQDPLRYNDNDDVEEYRVNIRVDISLWDRARDELVWQEDNFTGMATYFTSFYPVAADRGSESTTVREAIDDLARRIVERTVEVW